MNLHRPSREFPSGKQAGAPNPEQTEGAAAVGNAAHRVVITLEDPVQDVVVAKGGPGSGCESNESVIGTQNCGKIYAVFQECASRAVTSPWLCATRAARNPTGRDTSRSNPHTCGPRPRAGLPREIKGNSSGGEVCAIISRGEGRSENARRSPARRCPP